MRAFSEQARVCHEQARVRGEPCLQEYLPSLSNTVEHYDMLAETYRGAVRLSLKMCHDQLADYDKLRVQVKPCLLYTSPSPRDKRQSRMPSSA